MPALSDGASKEARAAAYRVIRHTIIRDTLVDYESINLFRQQGLDWYLVRCASLLQSLLVAFFTR